MINRLLLSAFIVYLGLLLRTLYKISHPSPCTSSSSSCIHPLIAYCRLGISIYASTTTSSYLPSDAQLLWSNANISCKETIITQFIVPIPPTVRTLQHTLYGYVVLHDASDNISPSSSKDSEVELQFQLTELRLSKKSRKNDPRNLLEPTVKGDEDMNVSVRSLTTKGYYSQYWKFGVHPLVLRYVHMDIPLEEAFLPELMEILNERHVYSTTEKGSGYYVRKYEPVVWIDEVSITQSPLLELSSNTSMPAPTCRIKFTPATLLHFAFKKTVREVLVILGRFLEEGELDEIRWYLSDDRLFRYFLSQMIAVLP